MEDQWQATYVATTDCLTLQTVPVQDTHDHLTLPTDERDDSQAVGINVCGHDITSVPDDRDRESL
jgi:hypothetical protein